MTSYKSLGFALGVCGTFLLWQAGTVFAPLWQMHGFGHLASALFDPAHSLKLLGAIAAFLAGLAALTERQGGAWLAGVSASLLAIMSISYLGGHGEVQFWQREAVVLLTVTGLFLAIVVSNAEKPATEEQEIST